MPDEGCSLFDDDAHGLQVAKKLGVGFELAALLDSHVAIHCAMDRDRLRANLTFHNRIFDGKLDGEIISEGTLILGKNAVVKGEVRTKSVTIHGTVNGNVTVQERCELKSNAELLGDLKAMRIIIEEGATFIGHSEVTPTKTASFTRSSAPSQVNENAA